MSGQQQRKRDRDPPLANKGGEGTALFGDAAYSSASLLKHPLEHSLSLLCLLKDIVGFPLLWTVSVGSETHAEPSLAPLVWTRKRLVDEEPSCFRSRSPLTSDLVLLLNALVLWEDWDYGLQKAGDVFYQGTDSLLCSFGLLEGSLLTSY